MSSIFTRIVNGEIPCYKIAEDENYLAFLDINPIKVGHTLVIPKKEVDYIFDLDEETYLGLMGFSKKVGQGIEKIVNCNRIGMAVLGLEVPHAHVHLTPIDTEGDLSFSNSKVTLSSEEMQSLADRISQEILRI